MALNFPRGKRAAAAETLTDPYGVMPSEPISVVRIPMLADDPEHGRLTAQHNTLNRALLERQHMIERYMINAELATASSTPAPGTQDGISAGRFVGSRKEMLRERLAKLNEFPTGIPEPAPEPEAEGLDPVVAVALRLAAGEEVPAPRDRDAHIQQLRSEIRTLDDASGIVRGQIAELREVRSIAVAEMVLPQQREILRSKMDAALALAAACDTERRLIAEVLQSGHLHCPGVLKSPPIDPAARLGSTSEWDSPISTYRRTLEQMGIIRWTRWSALPRHWKSCRVWPSRSPPTSKTWLNSNAPLRRWWMSWPSRKFGCQALRPFHR
jgi:hypothetical protein